MKKLLITGGCSFTFGDSNWPPYLAKALNCNLDNTALPALGNNLILHKTIIAVQQALEEYKPEDIIVGIIWSGITRYSYRTDMHVDLKHPFWIENYPTNLKGDRYWYQHNIHSEQGNTQNFYEKHYDQTQAAMDTLEKILLAQKVLESYGVDYFMGTYIEMFNRHTIDIKNPDVQYLYKLIDRSKFLPVDGLLPNNLAGEHPTEEQSKEFVSKYIIPHLKND